MDVKQTLSEGLKREYEITITSAQIAERVDARITSLATEVKMPGFRPGKVPASVVKSRYGKEVLGEVLQKALDDATRSIIEDNGLRVATNPNLDVTEYKEGGDLKAVMKIEIMPEIKAIDLAKLTIDRPVVEVADGEVDDAVEMIATENRPTKPIEKSRAVQNGDTVLIDFIGRIDGEAFEGGSAEGHRLAIGSNTFIPGFEDGLLGAMSETTVDVNVSFPNEYPAEHLAGKSAVFEVKINEIHEPDDVKIDDDFAATLGMENLDALKVAVREQISRQHASAIRAKVKTSLLDALDNAIGEFDIPPTLVEQEYSSICRAMNPHDHAEDGHDHDHDHDHKHDDGMSDEDKAEADMLAHRRVRLGMALTDIGRQNDLQVTEDEKNRAIFAEAQRYPNQEQQVLEYFQKNPDVAQQLVGPIFEDKVVDYILEIAKVNDNIITTDELYKADEVKAKPAAKKAAKKAAAKPAKKAAKKASAKPAAKKAAKKASTKKKD